MAERAPDGVFESSAFTIERPPLGAQVVDRLRELVLSGSLPPGTRLVQEQVAAELRVSRTPLREAIRILVHEGLLTSDARNSSVRVVELDDDDARDLYQIREVIDGLAARVAASRDLPAPQVRGLQDLLDRLDETTDPYDMNAFVVAHARFHLAVLDASGNARLEQMRSVVGMSAQMLFRRFATSGERIRKSTAEHRNILAAIVDGEPARAEELARAHIRAASDFWLAGEPDAPAE